MEQQLLAFLQHIESKSRYSNNTTAAYKNDLGQFLAFLQQSSFAHLTTWNEITEEVVNKYVDYMKTDTTYASSTVARKVAAVKSFFNYLGARDLIAENPATDVDSPKVKKRLPQTLTPEEVERLLAAPNHKESPKNLRDAALLTVLYATGMRVTEVVSLSVDDIDLDNQVLKCPGDNEETRQLPFNKKTHAILEAYLSVGRPNLVKEKTESALFLNHRGQQLTRQGLWLIIKAYARQVGLNQAVTPHTLRHSFAAHKLNSGSDLQEVQKLLGHANISTTQIYSQLNEEPSKKEEAGG
ncbi:MAG: tyrosine recombinase [Chloroflexota bacterium]|jgi:integrase/recombinase XerD